MLWLAVVLILSRLDYCNSVLIPTPCSISSRLKMPQHGPALGSVYTITKECLSESFSKFVVATYRAVNGGMHHQVYVVHTVITAR